MRRPRILFLSWGEGKSTLETASQGGSVPEEHFLFVLTSHSGFQSQSPVCSFILPVRLCTHTRVHTGAHRSVWEVEWSAQEDCVHLQVCYPCKTPLDSPEKRKGPLLGPRNKWVKMGILPTMPAHHFQHKRPLVAARDRRFTQSKCPYGQSQAAIPI